jgi:hypothetical protein
MREFAFILFVCSVAVAASFAGPGSAGKDGPQGVDGVGPAFPGRVEKPIAYRIRTEEAVTAPAGVTLTEEETKAIARLNYLMQRWPRKLWLFSNNGQLMLAKMGDDGKPMGACK